MILVNSFPAVVVPLVSSFQFNRPLPLSKPFVSKEKHD